MPLWRRLAASAYRLGVAWNGRHAGRVCLAGARVVSVGGLEAGGVGKTPCVLWWAAALQGHGPTAIVCRPYGGRRGEPGDEVRLLRERAPAGVQVVAGRDKTSAAREAERAGAGRIVLDDGFSHRRLRRDLDLLLLDAAEPFANRRLLPAGPLREPPEAAARADAVVLTRADRVAREGLEAARRAVRRVGFAGPILTARHRVVGLRVDGRMRSPQGLRVYCVSGLGRPGELAEAARRAGAEVVGGLELGDHALPGRAAWEEAGRRARDSGALLLGSAKDEARLPAAWRQDLSVLEMEWEWLEGDEPPDALVARAAAP